MTTLLDKQALKILFDTYWMPTGWKPESQQFALSENLAYAKSKGFMFEPVQLSHSQAISNLTELTKKLDKRSAANGFLSSLSTRRLDWRSVLGSYAVFQHMPPHNSEGDKNQCSFCGFYLNDKEHDLNVLNFERLKWGGVRHDQVVYALLDIDLFVKNSPPSPTAEDIQIFRKLISSIQKAQNVSSSVLNSCFTKDLKSNKAERDKIIALLGFCGIIGTPAHYG